MDPSCDAKQLSTPIESEKSSLAPSNTNENTSIVSTQDSSISNLPKELLSAIIDYVPKSQWPSLELVNRSFRDAVYSSWQSMKEFDIDKDVLGISQSHVHVHLVDFLPSILAKLQYRSPILQSIIGFPSIYSKRMKDKTSYRSEVLHIVCQFTNLKRIDFGTCVLTSVELIRFLTSSSSHDRLVKINSSADNQKLINRNWPTIHTDRENSESQPWRLKLKKLSLKNQSQGQFLDPIIIDLIDPSSLTVLVLDKIAVPSDYLLSLIKNCSQVQRLQFSFIEKCRCNAFIRPCIYLASSKRILEAIAALESLESLKIGLIDIGVNYSNYWNQHHLDIKDGLPTLIKRLGWRGRLVELCLLHQSYCSDQVIEGIADHLAGLKSLELHQKCYTWTFVSKIEKMVSLEKLTIFNDDNIYATQCYCDREISAAFQAMAMHLKNLRSFHLWLPFEQSEAD